MSVKPAAASHRVVFLDGVRGWASVVVVVHHLIPCFLAITTPAYRHWLATPFSDGDLAVYVFFVLSGFALSIRFVQTENPRVPVELALRRYPRLTLPIFASCALAFAMMKLHLFYNAAASASAPHEEWLATFYRFTPALGHFFKFTLYNVFFRYDTATSYDQVLWTMSTEFSGSMLVFLLCLMFPYIRARWTLLGILTGVMIVFHSSMLPFVFGVAIAFAFETSARRKYEHGRVALAISLLLIASAAAYSPISYRGFPTVNQILARNPLPTTIFAALLVFGISLSARVRGFFSLSLSRYLGSISFPLYLTHSLVILSLSSWLFLKHVNANVIVIVTLAVCFVSAELFKYVERASIYVARLCSDALMKSVAAPAKPRANAAAQQ